jgi:hypothetical protein
MSKHLPAIDEPEELKVHVMSLLIKEMERIYKARPVHPETPRPTLAQCYAAITQTIPGVDPQVFVVALGEAYTALVKERERL